MSLSSPLALWFLCSRTVATYSNLENHPRLIRARQIRPVPKIQLDPKTGLPIVDGEKLPTRASKAREVESITEVDEDENHCEYSSYHLSQLKSHAIWLATHVTITRPRDESKEEKRARKQAVKVERQQRRVDKKATKEQYSSEIKTQVKRLSDIEKTRMKKL